MQIADTMDFSMNSKKTVKKEKSKQKNEQQQNKKAVITIIIIICLYWYWLKIVFDFIKYVWELQRINVFAFAICLRPL